MERYENIADQTVQVTSDNQDMLVAVRMEVNNGEDIEKLNIYMKCFYKWDNQIRAEKKLTCIYSYSSSYIKSKDGISISALKFYPVSPHFSEKYVDQTVENLKKQKTRTKSNGLIC